ncbi:sulfatase [Echinicola shivajiensis]|uniref:sulfatase n=1 Tax=Echinicola shivajiensis TaxID=1035916 RepID=UPI001BFC8451|nr:sulfatase [Echinicola shivajiensis]
MRFIFLIGLIFIGLGLISCGQEKQVAPNIVFILVDDLGWADLACYGSDFYETPNIDALAKQGMRFTSAYAASPVCSPTRAAIMTGKYPSSVNITDWIPGQDPKGRKLLGPQDRNELALEEITIAELLKNECYKTFFAGKWHLGDKGFFPEDQGFDINIGGNHKGSPVSYYSPYHNPQLEDGPEGEYLSDRLVDESIKFMESAKEDPFLLYLSFYNVHTPIQANKKYVEHFRKKAEKLEEIADSGFRMEHDGLTKLRQDNFEYASMIAAMDENVGRLMDKLEELGLDENTLVVFTSDNGGLSTLQNNRKAPTSNEPLRAGKGWCYEGGIRVPLIIKGPGITPNSTSEEPVISIDFYNTISEAVNVSKDKIPENDGTSLMPLLKGNKSLDREGLYFHYPHYHGSAWEPGAAVRKGDYVYIEFYEDEKVELYNIKEDLEETNDLSSKMPEKVAELKTVLNEFHEKTGAQFPINNPEFNKEKPKRDH